MVDPGSVGAVGMEIRVWCPWNNWGVGDGVETAGVDGAFGNS